MAAGSVAAAAYIPVGTNVKAETTAALFRSSLASILLGYERLACSQSYKFSAGEKYGGTQNVSSRVPLVLVMMQTESLVVPTAISRYTLKKYVPGFFHPLCRS